MFNFKKGKDMTKLSILDLVFVNEEDNVSDALKKSLIVARKVEELGYNRIWVAEHHNMQAIASAATSVVIGYLAGGTERIRIGAGGIMLPNHAPLLIAEQFGTLASLYPDRIDLGLGRAPGTDQQTMMALRKDPRSSNNFPDDVLELQHYLSKDSKNDKIQASPGMGLEVPLWILGSSTFGAQLAAEFGLPYSFASHFSPDSLFDAIGIYRSKFKPSTQLKTPYIMLGVNVIIADTDEEAQYLATSQKQSFANLRRGVKSKFQKPLEDINSYWSLDERMMAMHMLKYSFIGTKEKVEKELKEFIHITKADELMVVTSIYDVDKKISSLHSLAEIDLNL
jgi:luciferase family oxidoreductase group 1